MTVISPKGVNAYNHKNLTGKVANYKQGTVLKVKGIVKHNLTTRYILTNGKYVTANRKLVKMGRHAHVTKVRAKAAINRYQDVNLTKRNRHLKKGTTLKVHRYEYSQPTNLSQHGTLRYRVAGGYITGNAKYVKAIR
ncbi:lipoprotein [Lentilactobacillus rapi DSM 19907 = JCM 15042]|uniref:Lipoprotein n=1 Tax=Lentilactobacillus rapi DSM 19907 = JCM 15042 TaxID=1423795 RepID=A0ABR5PF01_9LACO|nr:lipoprotein [Lentilactobacillus rapi DSM 19907 = JCM 15042]